MRIVLTLLAVLSPLPALAGDIAITLRDKQGRPVSNAVASVYPSAGLPAGPIRFPWAMTMGQKDITFDPTVLIVPVGARVTFPNYDKVRHHVYSFSPGNKFEFKLYGDEAPGFVFKTVGAAAIGCNIHDRMAAYIRVVDTPYVAKSDANGVITVKAVPGGAARLVVWQPFLKAARQELALSVAVPNSGTASYAQVLDLRPSGRRG